MIASRIHAVLLTSVILATVVALFVPIATNAAAVLCLIAAGLGVFLVRGTSRVVSLLLTSVGVAALLIGVMRGGTFVLPLALNQDLIAMLAAVSFLRLITPAKAESTSRLRGLPAVIRTTLAVHLLGSVINMVSITIVADKLREASGLHRADAIMLSRAYATGAFWSPFWVAAAAAAALAPGAIQPQTALVGAAVAVCALILTIVDVARANGERLASYEGYALSWHLWRIPLALVTIVVVFHLLFPLVSIPRAVMVGALAVAIVGVAFTYGRRALRVVVDHAFVDLSSLRAEATLFVAAGVLTMGIRVLLPTIDATLPFAGYDAWLAWASVIAMVALAFFGLHPLASLALIASLTLPLHPDPTLFVLAGSIGWGLGAAASSTSGMIMHLGGRYGVDPLRLSVWNLPFAAAVIVLALPALLLAERLVL